MELILSYIWKQRKYLIFNLLGVGAFILIQIGIPTVFEHVLNDAVTNALSDQLKLLVTLMLVFAIIGFFGELLLAYATTKISTCVIENVRNDFFTKTQFFSNAEFEKFGISSLITSLTSDSYQIMLFTQMLLRIGFITPFMMLAGFIMTIRSSPNLSVWVFATIPILALLIFVITRFSEPISKKQQGTLDEINLLLRENLSGLRVIRAFNNEEFQSNRFEKKNDEYSKLAKKMFRLTAISNPSFYLLFSMLIVILLWFGSVQMSIDISVLQPGTLAVLIEYVFHILYSALLASSLIIMYPRAAVSAKRIKRVLDSEISITSPKDGLSSSNKAGTIEFKNVSFAYPEDDVEEAVLRNITLTIEKGSTVAFIGSTGSGKSTLIQLIPRLYDVTKGYEFVDGKDVRDYTLADLRNKFGFIPQKAHLFTGTIAENLRFGNESASIEMLKRATDIAQSTDFVEQKEKKFDDILSEGGSNLSGGQKQRLAIARAIVKDPEFYIFDDSFSALDYQTDRNLRKAIRNNIEDATILIVAQRVGTIMDADKIFVLDNGKLVAEGTHQDLLKNSSLYYEIASSQLSQKELGL